MLSVKQAAEKLGVSGSTVYHLAAPNGPIPCNRIGRAVRFMESDLQEYLQSCRFTSTKQSSAGVSNLTASSPGASTGLLDSFRKAGAKPKHKPTTSAKLQGSTTLRLVKPRTSR